MCKWKSMRVKREIKDAILQIEEKNIIMNVNLITSNYVTLENHKNTFLRPKKKKIN